MYGPCARSADVPQRCRRRWPRRRHILRAGRLPGDRRPAHRHRRRPGGGGAGTADRRARSTMPKSAAALRDLDVMRTAGWIVTTPLQARARADLLLLVGGGLLAAWPALAERLDLAAPPSLYPGPAAPGAASLPGWRRPWTGAPRRCAACRSCRWRLRCCARCWRAGPCSAEPACRARAAAIWPRRCAQHATAWWCGPPPRSIRRASRCCAA